MSIAGFISSFPASVLYCPFEIAKLYAQRGSKFYDFNWGKPPRTPTGGSPFKPLIYVQKKGGHGRTLNLNPNIYKLLTMGLKETVIREVPFNIIYFPLYHLFKQNDIPLAGGFAGTLSWILIYPLDVIKTLKQIPDKNISVSFLWKHYGIKGFYNGIFPTILRAFPTHLVTLQVYELIRPGN
jgi:hypothetical protein